MRKAENIGDFAVSIGSTTIDHINYLADPYGDEIEFLSYYTYEPRSRQNMNFSYQYEKHQVNVNMTRMGHMNIVRNSSGEQNLIHILLQTYHISMTLILISILI